MTYYVLSFDIGIKNLAYCLIEYNKEEPLRGDDDAPKGGPKDLESRSDGQDDILGEKEEESRRAVRRTLSCEATDDDAPKGREESLFDDDERILLWEVLPIFESKRKNKKKKKKNNASNISYQVLSKHLYQRLEEIKEKLINVSVGASLRDSRSFGPPLEASSPLLFVIIERQMTAKMKTLAGMIFMYFSVYQNIINEPFKIQSIEYFSAKHKLSDMVYTPKETDKIQLKSIKSPKNSYNYRKNLSKQYCNILIHRNQSDNFIEFFKASKKKDDLSDCFLQAISFIKLDKFDKLNKIK